MIWSISFKLDEWAVHGVAFERGGDDLDLGFVQVGRNLHEELEALDASGELRTRVFGEL